MRFWLLIFGFFITSSVSQASTLETHLPASTVKRMIVAEAQKQGLPPALALAVAEVESNFHTHAHSGAGARGVMQIMPNTARGEFGVASYRLWHPQTNIYVGVRFLKQLVNTYGRADIALSHYNGGSAVRRSDGSLRVIPATRKYVNKVLGRVDYYERIYPTASYAASERPAITRTSADMHTSLARLQRANAQRARELNRTSSQLRIGTTDWQSW